MIATARTSTLCHALALCLVSGLSQAATFSVTRTDDPIPNGCASSDCSLREAVIEANATAVADTIVLGVGTYELFQTTLGGSDALSFDLNVTQNLDIIGQGTELTIIRNATGVDNAYSRVFSISQAAVNMSGLSVRDGSLYSTVLPIFGNPLMGGCILARDAVLNLSQVNLSNCRINAPAGRGGAMFMSGTTAAFADVRIEDNVNLPNGSGGALGLLSTSIDFLNVAIDSNSAGYGGGIHAYGDVYMTGSNVQVTRNTADFGGAIFIGYASERVLHTINWSTQSRIAQNSAGTEGGAIYVGSGASLEIAPLADASIDRDDLLLIEDNHAIGDGGAIYVGDPSGTSAPGSLDARRIAVRLNTAGARGGGVYSKGKAHITDSEFAMNDAGTDGGGAALTGAATDYLIERTSFFSNNAGRDGGAISIGADNVKLRNVSTYSNSARGYGGGVSVSPRSSVNLVHFTSATDGAASGGSVAVAFNGVAHLRNSVLAAGCFKSSPGTPFAGTLIDDGGSAQQSGQAACQGATFGAAKLGLRYAYFGGRFDVVGIA